MPGTIIRSLTTPSTEPYGLAFDGRTLWHSDTNTERIYQIDPVSGTVIRSFLAPDVDITGIAQFGDKLLLVAYGGTFYLVDRMTGTTIRSFTVTGLASLSGLASDGRNLYFCGFIAKRIYQVDLATGTLIMSLVTPSSQPRAVALSDGYLWHIDTNTNLVYLLWSDSATVITSFATPGAGSVGLCFDGRTLWVSSQTIPRIHQVSL